MYRGEETKRGEREEITREKDKKQKRQRLVQLQ